MDGDQHERRGERVLFVSDVHLSLRAPEIFRDFIRFLDAEAPGAAALYLLGDLFDFWVGPKQARLPGFDEVFRRTRQLREQGTQVYFQEGNRDYMLGGAFATAQGLRVLPDVAETVVGERRILLTHGDLLCTRDLAYQRMRRVIRGRLARRLLAALPLRASLRLAGGFRRASGSEIRRKSRYELGLDLAEARNWLSRGHDALICGHVHQGRRYRFDFEDRDADLFVLDSWEDGANFVRADGDGLELRAWP